jgi:dihydrofolate reductase
MRIILAAYNSTRGGFWAPWAGWPDADGLAHYTALLNESDAILYGRTTYELMDFWRPLVKNPTGEKAMDDFAIAIDRIPKIVFSHTLTTTGWDSATLADAPPEDVAVKLKQQPGRDILVGSRSLIVQLANLGLIDEFQLCIHPVIAGKGLMLFDNIKDRTVLKLVKTKTFGGGAVILYYEPASHQTP